MLKILSFYFRKNQKINEFITLKICHFLSSTYFPVTHFIRHSFSQEFQTIPGEIHEILKTAKLKKKIKNVEPG